MWTQPALALQPVTEFLVHATTWNPQNRAARATTEQRDAETSISTASLLPSFSAQGTYTRNEYEVTTASLIPVGSSSNAAASAIASSIPNVIIQPLDQFDANLQINVPIINVASWDRRAAAKATLAGAQASQIDQAIQVQRSILRDYYSLIADEAVVLSAATNLEVAKHNLKLAHDRAESGTGSTLDIQRAIADQAKAEQNVTSAHLSVVTTRRDLYSLSGLEPEPATTFPEDGLQEEAPLEQWTGKAAQTPSVASAVAQRETAEDQASVANRAWFPTVAGVAEEKFTNATAFVGGHSAVYLLQVALMWKLDASIPAQVKAQNAAAAAARANEDRAKLSAEDAVYRDWYQIRADIDSARSSRAQVQATKLAASLAEERYQNGIATQLDVLQARQDAFAADVARIQADADLAYARTALRLDAGQLQGMSK